MPRILDHIRTRILQLHQEGRSVRDIQSTLADGGNVHSCSGIRKLIGRYGSTGALTDAYRQQPSLFTEDDLDFIHERMLMDDETTAEDLRRMFHVDSGRTFSLPTIRRARRKLGWIATGAKYCQLIRDVNRIKRLEYACDCLSANEQFSNVVFTDECTVQLDHHAKVCFRHVHPETGEAGPRKLKPRPKHPTKVHVWAGMSARGCTEIRIFEGIMDQDFYQSILGETLVPFVTSVFPEGHRFMQDNDPKHTSRRTVIFMEEHGINWWKTPPESPDLNPIEQVWHEMKHFLRKTHKPHTKEQLMSGIRLFWRERMSPEKCQKYIGNLPKALIKVIECGGQATGY